MEVDKAHLRDSRLTGSDGYLTNLSIALRMHNVTVARVVLL
jgi:hypothetical protein